MTISSLVYCESVCFRCFYFESKSFPGYTHANSCRGHASPPIDRNSLFVQEKKAVRDAAKSETTAAKATAPAAANADSSEATSATPATTTHDSAVAATETVPPANASGASGNNEVEGEGDVEGARDGTEAEAGVDEAAADVEEAEAEASTAGEAPKTELKWEMRGGGSRYDAHL